MQTEIRPGIKAAIIENKLISRRARPIARPAERKRAATPAESARAAVAMARKLGLVE